MIRPASEADFPGIAPVAQACGQPATDSGADREYVRHLLAHGNLLVAVIDEELIGFGATRTVGRASVLTDLFVSPSSQRRGVGRAILQELWGAAEQARITFSSQHPSALPLYARCGLKPPWPLLYLVGSASRLTQTGLEVGRVSASEAATVEATLTAVDRRDDYSYWPRSDPATGVVVFRGCRPVATGAAGRAGIAHFVCPSLHIAADALVAALAASGGDEFTLCLPGPHPALPILLRSGFTIVDYDIHMSSGSARAPISSVYSPSLA